MKLIGYFRSSAAYRVRIALNLKGVVVEHASKHLRKGEQKSPDEIGGHADADWRRLGRDRFVNAEKAGAVAVGAAGAEHVAAK